MTDDLNPAQHAGQIEAARQRLLEFTAQCTDADWSAAPVQGDPRPVGVILDHVAHSYEYLAGWICDIVAGQDVDVNPGIVDELNAEHAADTGSVTKAHVTGHLTSSGDALLTLIAGLKPDQLDAGDGRVRRFAMIAARHGDDHRAQIETSLAAAAD
jgi:DinB superfamily